MRIKFFANNAWDAKNFKLRSNDTEVKFIDWFFRTQWHKGNVFNIELESVLYTCPSCQRHLMKFVEYGRLNGKTINIKFITNSNVISLNDIKKL